MLRHNRAVREYRNQTVRDRDWKTKLIVLVGPTGCGKSRFCREQFPNAYWKPPGEKWFDGYEGQDAVVLDDFYGWIPFHLLLRLADRYPMLVETKGGSSKFVARTLVITSNKPMEEWYREEVRVRYDFRALERRVDELHTWESDGTKKITKGS